MEYLTHFFICFSTSPHIFYDEKAYFSHQDLHQLRHLFSNWKCYLNMPHTLHSLQDLGFHINAARQNSEKHKIGFMFFSLPTELFKMPCFVSSRGILGTKQSVVESHTYFHSSTCMHSSRRSSHYLLICAIMHFLYL